MKNQPKTVIQTLAERLREQSQRFNANLESAPVAVLWTDERREWEGVMPQLKSALPELFSLGDYKPQERSGPGAWLRMVADRQAGGWLPDRCPSSICPVWPRALLALGHCAQSNLRAASPKPMHMASVAGSMWCLRNALLPNRREKKMATKSRTLM